MPVRKCPNGKYRIGSGKCIYDSKAKAERAYRGYLASRAVVTREQATEMALEELEMKAQIDSNFTVLEGVEAGNDQDWTLRNVAVLGPRSQNGRRYPQKVRKRAVKLYEGVQVVVDHDPSQNPSKVRSVRDFIGVLEGVSLPFA